LTVFNQMRPDHVGNGLRSVGIAFLADHNIELTSQRTGQRNAKTCQRSFHSVTIYTFRNTILGKRSSDYFDTAHNSTSFLNPIQKLWPRHSPGGIYAQLFSRRNNMVVAMCWLRSSRTQTAPSHKSCRSLSFAGLDNYIADDLLQCFWCHLNTSVNGHRPALARALSNQARLQNIKPRLTLKRTGAAN